MFNYKEYEVMESMTMMRYGVARGIAQCACAGKTKLSYMTANNDGIGALVRQLCVAGFRASVAARSEKGVFGNATTTIEVSWKEVDAAQSLMAFLSLER